MTKEWKNEFCSFNSWKGIHYLPNYYSVKNGKFLPPIEASLDPIHRCNAKCAFCNAHRYVKNDYEMNLRRMPDKHMYNLIVFLGKWKVKAICFGGGGEPTLHTILPSAIRLTKGCGMQAAVATNGILWNKELIETMASCCRWIGISVDSATKETYKKGKQVDSFDSVTKNIQFLAEQVSKLKTNCEITFKFLVFDFNQHEIFQACALAKKLGATEFHARPADFSHQGMDEFGKPNPYNVDEINKQFALCHKLEDDKFKIYTVLHKYNDSFVPKKDFSQCYAAPICIQLCAEDVFFCPDSRHMEFYKLGSHYPNPENILNFWGGKKHRELVFKTGKVNCKSRCTFTAYNKQCEKLVIEEDKDWMCKNFV